MSQCHQRLRQVILLILSREFSMGNGLVDRCVCFNISFFTIKEKLQSGLSVAEVKKDIPCCTKCRLCSPYIEEIKKTGKTNFTLGEFNKK